MLEALVPLLTPSHSREEDEVERSSWMAVNWLIYVDEGKQRFLKAGGLNLLLSALRKSPLCSGVVFAARKLAMHGPSQRTLIDSNVCALLVNRASELGLHEDRMRYVITLALSFLILDPIDDAHKQIISSSGAHACIAHAVTAIGIDQNLNVLYTSLQDQRQLISNPSLTAQSFGLWWTLHLLSAESAGHYKRKDYARMVIEEGLLPRILALLHSNDSSVAKLAALLVESLAKTPHVRLRVIEGGGLSQLLLVAQSSPLLSHALNPNPNPNPEIDQLRSVVTSATALLIAYAPDLDSELPRGRVPTLRATCEHFALRAIDEESVATLTDLAYTLHLPRLQARCLAFLTLSSDPQTLPMTSPFDSKSPSTKAILCDLEFIKSNVRKVEDIVKGEGTPMH